MNEVVRGVSSTSQYLSISLPPNDARMAYRLVGFYEYGMALQNFDRLLKLLSPDELVVVNEMVKAHDEFTVYTNLARRWQAQGTPLSEPAEREGDDFARRGLDWVIALARVELGAMLAGFTGQAAPFEMLGSTEFELPAYREMILDGARSHYLALASDAAIPQLRNEPPTNPLVLSYSRRALIAQAFVRAAIRLGVDHQSPDELRLLVAWKQQVDKLQSDIVASIAGYLSIDGLRLNEMEREYYRACGALLEGMKRDLKNGTAKVIKLK